jgi:hypothetical protein
MTAQTDLFTRRVRKPPLALELRIAAEPGWLWTHFPSGEKRDTQAGARLKRMGLKPGFFDLMLIGPSGELHFLEIKRGAAPLTPAQRYFQVQMQMRGVPCAVARNYEAAETQLRAWGVLRGRVSA